MGRWHHVGLFSDPSTRRPSWSARHVERRDLPSPFAMAFSFTGSKSQASATNEQKEALKQRVSTEIAMANAQQLISKATDKCYTKCVPTPGSSLSSKEQTCAERCLERYFEAFNIVSATYVRRIAAERASGALATEAA